MAIAFVQRMAPNGATAAPASSVVTTAASTTTGNLLVVGIGRSQLANVSSVVDTAGNTWIQAINNSAYTTNRTDIWYAYNITGNAANIVTVTFALATVYAHVACYEFSGFSTTDPLDATVANVTGSGTSISTGTVSVAGSEDVIVAKIVADSNGMAAGSGYTLTDFAVSGDATKYFADEYKIVTASEAATATCSSGGWGACAASFKIVTAASGWGGLLSNQRNRLVYQ